MAKTMEPTETIQDKKKDGAKFCYECDVFGHSRNNCPVLQITRQLAKTMIRSKYEPDEDSVDELLSLRRIKAGPNFKELASQLTAPVKYQPMKKFDQFDELKILSRSIRKLLQWKVPTPVQQQSIPLILEGYDIMSCAPTGSGKTGAYLLPIIAKLAQGRYSNVGSDDTSLEPRALILAPTRELAVQIWQETRILAQNTRVKSYCVYGGTGRRHQAQRLQDENFDILIATPGRLLDFVKDGRVDLLPRCKYLILDEADNLLDRGFKDNLYEIAHRMKAVGDRQTLMFSATYPKAVQKLAHNFLQEHFPFLSLDIVGAACRDICQTIEQVDSQMKKCRLLEILNQDLIDSPKIKDKKVFTGQVCYTKKTLVFAETISKVKNVCAFLIAADLPVACLHRLIKQHERENILKNFKTGFCPILLATAIASRGLDIVGVDHVINYDMPKRIDEYVQKIGRTGRIGNTGRSTTFYDPGRDSGMGRYLVKILSDAQQEVPEFLQKLDVYIGNTGLVEASKDWE